MELLGLLVILAAIAEKVGQALAWCLVTLTKGFGILLLAIVRLIIASINNRQRSSTQDKSQSPESTVNPNTEDAIRGLKQLGVPHGAAKKIAADIAAKLGPDATLDELLAASLKSMDRR